VSIDVSHGCGHFPGGSFARWRRAVAKAAGIPLPLMDGYGAEPAALARGLAVDSEPWDVRRWVEEVIACLPIPWSTFAHDPIVPLLNTPDDDGGIAAVACGSLADRLEQLLALLTDGPGDDVDRLRARTRTFIDGLRRAAVAGEDVTLSG